LTELPQALNDLITAKSTKKESTKFGAKINALLDWIGDDPARQNVTGLKKGLNDCICVKKSVLSQVFQIQVDSLALNFKRNKVIPAGTAGDWSVFRCPPDFLKKIQVDMTETGKATRQARLSATWENRGESRFTTRCRENWKLMLDNRSVVRIRLDKFCLRILDVYGLRGMDRSDLFRMLSHFVFTRVPGFVQYEDFAQLFANFGEDLGIFPKMIALVREDLELKFLELICVEDMAPVADTIRVFFLTGDRFGFLIVWPNGSRKRVRNDFDCPYHGEYLVDDEGQRYHTWRSVFR
jgi:hypothetical protein